MAVQNVVELEEVSPHAHFSCSQTRFAHTPVKFEPDTVVAHTLHKSPTWHVHDGLGVRVDQREPDLAPRHNARAGFRL